MSLKLSCIVSTAAQKLDITRGMLLPFFASTFHCLLSMVLILNSRGNSASSVCPCLGVSNLVLNYYQITGPKLTRSNQLKMSESTDLIQISVKIVRIKMSESIDLIQTVLKRTAFPVVICGPSYKVLLFGLYGLTGTHVAL
jgi:hypothetical protein